MSEADFLRRLGDGLEPLLGHRPHLHRFREVFLGALHPNAEMIGLMRELREGGLRMAMLTNNVREWEPVWRAKLPVDEIFETVVDSAFVGCRKPEARIYEITVERLGLAPGACLFVDDIEANCEAARELRPARGPLPRDRAGDRRDPRGARLRPHFSPHSGRNRGLASTAGRASHQGPLPSGGASPRSRASAGRRAAASCWARSGHRSPPGPRNRAGTVSPPAAPPAAARRSPTAARCPSPS